MIAEDIKELAGSELKPDGWYTNQLEQALAEVQQRNVSLIDTQGVEMGNLFSSHIVHQEPSF